MKIDDLTVWTVNVPYSRPFTSSFEVRAGTTRTVLRLRTDDGLEGWGETMHGRPVAAIIERVFPGLRGTDPFALERSARELHMVPYFHGYLGAAALAGMEMARWDLIGKATGQPIANLIGGALADRVEVTTVLTPGLVGDPSGARELADALADEITAPPTRTSRCGWTRTRTGRCPGRWSSAGGWRPWAWSTWRTRFPGWRGWRRCGRG